MSVVGPTYLNNKKKPISLAKRLSKFQKKEIERKKKEEKERQRKIKELTKKNQRKAKRKAKIREKELKKKGKQKAKDFGLKLMKKRDIATTKQKKIRKKIEKANAISDAGGKVKYYGGKVVSGAKSGIKNAGSKALSKTKSLGSKALSKAGKLLSNNKKRIVNNSNYFDKRINNAHKCVNKQYKASGVPGFGRTDITKALKSLEKDCEYRKKNNLPPLPQCDEKVLQKKREAKDILDEFVKKKNHPLGFTNLRY